VATRALTPRTPCRKKPVVVLSEDVLANPEGMLRAMCAHAGIDFDPAMLRWSAGPKPYDGVWAPYWYRQVHHSTGAPRGMASLATSKRPLHKLAEEPSLTFARRR
jgi:hypothetical protein